MPIYLDNAATSFPKPESVYRAIDEANRSLAFAVGRGRYQRGNDSARILENTRNAIAELISSESPRQISFAFSGTDALCTAISGYLRPGDHVVASVVDHTSVLRPIWNLEAVGVEATIVGCDITGRIDPSEIESEMRANTRLVCAPHANNVTGALQPVMEIGELCRKYSTTFLVDAAQTLGHTQVNVGDIGCDILAGPGHKGLFGPMGTGFLYASSAIVDQISPLRHGGTGSHGNELQQPSDAPRKFESGNQNVAGVAGLLAGIEWLQTEQASEKLATCIRLTNLIRNELGIIKHVHVYGDSQSHLTGTVSFNVEGVDCQTIGMILDSQFQIECRTGIHCAPLIHEKIGSGPYGGTVRLSPGLFTTESDIELVVGAIQSISSQIGAISP